MQRLQDGVPFSAAVDNALLLNSCVGGSRPKAMLTDNGRPVIAKFASETDRYPVVQGECLAMTLARAVGLDVASVELTCSLGSPVLLVDRFDRGADSGTRRGVVSALTVLGLDERFARYASYVSLAQQIRERFADPRAALRELFARIVFSVLIGNHDDHPRNHSAFWDGHSVALTPAYDLCPQRPMSFDTQQAMTIGAGGFQGSNVAGCVEAASTYMLSGAQAREIVDEQIAAIRAGWHEACDRAQLSGTERETFWGGAFMNRHALAGYG